MANLKVIVPLLNKRNLPVPDTRNTDNVIGKVKDGFSFESVEQQTNAAGNWFKDRDGSWYWGRGLEITDTSAVLGVDDLATQFPWWLKNNLYAIPDLWNQPAGPKVTIALLDTGINEHVDFDFSKITGFNYLNNSVDYKTDDFGHGTHLAGIMIAKGVKSFGVMPVANLFVAKVCDSNGTPNFSAVKQALADILNSNNGAKDIDVINMSFDLAVGTDTVQIQLRKDIEALIKQIVLQKKCVCVAACGDDGLDTDDPIECFPALMEECISVGGLNEKLQRDGISNKSVQLDIMAPCTNIVSSNGKDKAIPMRGTSQSAAFVSAVCAFGIQKLKSKNTFSDTMIKNMLLKTAKSSGEPPIEFGHGIINPNLFISTL